MPWIKVADVAELAPNKPKLIDHGGKQVGLYLINGQPYAILNYCPHFGAPLCLGSVTGAVSSTGPGEQDYDHGRHVIRCPWHRWEFDMDTGAALTPIKHRIRIFPSEVRDEEVWMEVREGREPGKN